MTTIVWDGKQLVADTCLTVIKAIPELIRLLRPFNGNNCVKISTGEKFLFQGEKVHAIGGAGDAGIIGIINYLRDEEPVVTELIDSDCLSVATNANFGRWEIIVVLDNHIGYIWLEDSGGKRDVRFMRFLRNGMQMAIGSGSSLIEHFFNRGLTGQQLVSIARKLDPITGGELSVWNAGTITQERMVRNTGLLWILIKQKIQRMFERKFIKQQEQS